MAVYLAFESQRVSLPVTRTCVTYSADARKVLGAGRTFLDVQQTAALSLQNFQARTGHAAAVWFDDQPCSDSQNQNTTLLTMYLGTDAITTRDDLSAFSAPILTQGSPWSADGVFSRPDEAFASLVRSGDALYQVWEEGPSEPEMTLLVGGLVPRRATRPFSRCAEDDFLPWTKHARAVTQVPDPVAARRKRTLELAFALTVAERIASADGHVDEAETALLERLFPAEELAELWLDDPELRRAMARQAETELPGLLGHHQKIALLSTFYATCYADGNIDVRELKVLKEASAVLGLASADVVAALRRLW